MNPRNLNSIFSSIRNLKIGVLGDFALDFYYDLERETGEISIETGKEVFHGSSPRPIPGGAGTIVNNLSALAVQDIYCFGLIGKDIFGRELRYQLKNRGADLSGIIEVDEAWDSYVYTKAYTKSVEGNRVDFGSQNSIHPHDFQKICRLLEELLPDLDVLIINQQFKSGITAPNRLIVLKELLQKFPKCLVISDLRDSTGALGHGLIKGNLSEIKRILPLPANNLELDPMEMAKKVYSKTGLPILMTLGEKGMIYVDEEQNHKIAGIPLEGPLDITGAGDACLSAFATCMGIKIPIAQAIYIANLAAAVSVQKLQETGSASPEEISALALQHPLPSAQKS
ncbi:MAG: PfkB family carbohydrate kinase [Bacteroidota bacterium]